MNKKVLYKTEKACRIAWYKLLSIFQNWPVENITLRTTGVFDIIQSCESAMHYVHILQSNIL